MLTSLLNLTRIRKRQLLSKIIKPAQLLKILLPQVQGKVIS